MSKAVSASTDRSPEGSGRQLFGKEVHGLHPIIDYIESSKRRNAYGILYFFRLSTATSAALEEEFRSDNDGRYLSKDAGRSLHSTLNSMGRPRSFFSSTYGGERRTQARYGTGQRKSTG